MANVWPWRCWYLCLKIVYVLASICWPLDEKQVDVTLLVSCLCFSCIYVHSQFFVIWTLVINSWICMMNYDCHMKEIKVTKVPMVNVMLQDTSYSSCHNLLCYDLPFCCSHTKELSFFHSFQQWTWCLWLVSEILFIFQIILIPKLWGSLHKL